MKILLVNLRGGAANLDAFKGFIAGLNGITVERVLERTGVVILSSPTDDDATIAQIEACQWVGSVSRNSAVYALPTTKKSTRDVVAGAIMRR